MDRLKTQRPSLSGKGAQLIRSLVDDLERNYFTGGDAEMAVFDEKCIFEDPYGSFDGVESYKDNARKVGALMKGVQVEVVEWREAERTVTAVWQLSCVLDGPLNPTFTTEGRTMYVRSEVRCCSIETSAGSL